MKKEEKIPPTVIKESLMVTCIIDAMEGCDVAVTNISGAFLYTDTVHVNCIVRTRICGVVKYLMVNIEPTEFSEKVFLEGGQKGIYADPKKALYSALIESPLFWIYLYCELGYWGFETNMYERCVMNKTVDGKQCTI